MPTYTYKCTACDDVIEKRQSFSDAPLTTCEHCGGSLRKVIHPVGIVFKGSGWYVTDSRSSTSSVNGSGTKSSGEGDSASKSSESAAPKSDSAPKTENTNSSSSSSSNSSSSTSTTSSGG